MKEHELPSLSEVHSRIVSLELTGLPCSTGVDLFRSISLARERRYSCASDVKCATTYLGEELLDGDVLELGVGDVPLGCLSAYLLSWVAGGASGALALPSLAPALTVGKGETQSLNEDVEVLDAVELELQHVDAVHLLHRLDDAQCHERSEALAIGRALPSAPSAISHAPPTDSGPARRPSPCSRT